MMLFFIMMSWTLSLIFMFLNHPLSFGFILLLQTILISISSGILNFDYWFSYILFLIMIGGMLVLFIYMTSIASNEKFKFSYKLTLFTFIMIILMLSFIFLDNSLYLSDMNADLMNQSLYKMNYLSMNKFMNFPNMMILILLMIYLLMTLIAIVKITNPKMGGPLRQKN
uniref:NADH-ubiquinone oxidoreductase chain 6 n=1 Tax=Naupactus xanthographus TaxID=114905 RepID=D8WKR0_NAUXA|nr:NADH dehydrogenase subunit 6 [Naupactus xanthographus]ACZ58593.1 NADH dehydrogenase subunit 6 [Naupactus xanthographus]